MNKVFASLSALALAGALASPVAAQSITVKASVPFDFTLGTRNLPAGDYTVSAFASTAVVSARNDARSGDSALTLSIREIKVGAPGRTSLVFHRYGDQYFLSQIWQGESRVGRIIPMSPTEREVSKRASVRQLENVTILARL